MMPRENTANLVSAPPENRSMNVSAPWLRTWLWRLWRAARSMFGAGMADPNRKTAMMASVNRIFLRRSGILNALAKAFST